MARFVATPTSPTYSTTTTMLRPSMLVSALSTAFTLLQLLPRTSQLSWAFSKFVAAFPPPSPHCCEGRHRHRISPVVHRYGTLSTTSLLTAGQGLFPRAYRLLQQHHLAVVPHGIGIGIVYRFTSTVSPISYFLGGHRLVPLLHPSAAPYAAHGFVPGCGLWVNYLVSCSGIRYLSLLRCRPAFSRATTSSST